ncbi:MAG: OmpA family protein [Pseudomonadota bacterium]
MKSTGFKLKSITSALSLATLALIASPLAIAQDAFWYAGGNVGRTEMDMNEAKVLPQMQRFGYSTTGLTADDDDIGAKALLGYKFNRFLAVEGSYFDLGKFGYRAVLVPDANLAANIRPIGYAFDVVGFLPVSDATSLFARAGLTYAETREYFSARNLASFPFAKNDNAESNLKYGFGLQHDFTDNLGMRVEAERYRIEEPMGLADDVDMYSVGVVYRFGTKAAAPAPAAAPVAAAPRAAPAPAPAPATPPPPAAPTRITLMADTAFDFDKATLKPEGRAELDKLIADLRTLDYGSITVDGHTDRIGSDQYNQDLSQRRAQAVKDYLVSTGNIATAKVNANGEGESSPVTRADQCNNLERPALITCLAPDRRVEVEVVATK